MSENKPNNHNIVFALLIATVVTLPWFYGGEVNWQYNFFQIVIFISLGIVVVNYQTNSTSNTEHELIKSVRIPLLLLFVLIALAFLQALSLPLNIVELLAPRVAAYYRETPTILGSSDIIAALSISQSDTLQEGFKQASYVAVFILTLVLVNTRKKAIVLISTLFGTALLTAIHAIINYHTNGSFMYIDTLAPWQATTHETIHGPLSYKNHYASFLTITIPLGISLLFYKKSKTTNQRTLQAFNFIFSKRGMLFASCTFMVAILIFNTSRAGLLAFAASIVLTLCFCYYLNPKKFYLKKIGITTIAVLAVVCVVLISGLSDRLIERVSNYGENGRDILRGTTTSIIQDHWLLGTGAGTFASIQHTYKSELLSGNKMWQHAHNDYLEMLSNQGIVGAGLLGAAILLLFYQLILSIKNNKNSMRCIQVGGLCSLLSILIHSFADFNFQLPVNAVYFFVILAICLKAPLLRSQKKDNSQGANKYGY